MIDQEIVRSAGERECVLRRLGRFVDADRGLAEQAGIDAALTQQAHHRKCVVADRIVGSEHGQQDRGFHADSKRAMIERRPRASTSGAKASA
jgi:hypothetical protein